MGTTKWCGVKEQDLQNMILRSLGQEQIRFVKKSGIVKPVMTGIFVDKDGCYFWRCNAGERIYEYETKSKGRRKGKFAAAPAGTADILGVVLGTSVAFEVKLPGKKRSDVQVWWANIHRNAGGYVWRVDRVEEPKRLVIELKRTIRGEK